MEAERAPRPRSLEYKVSWSLGPKPAGKNHAYQCQIERGK